MSKDGNLSLEAMDGLRETIEQFEQRSEEEEEKARALISQAAIHQENAKRLRRAVASLRGEPLGAGGRQAQAAPSTPQDGKRKKEPNSKGLGISEEKLEEVRQAVLEYAQDHDEFRQVDIRGILGMPSNRMTIAFERLRQEGFLRLARASGNSKYFRLTREAVNAGSASS